MNANELIRTAIEAIAGSGEEDDGIVASLAAKGIEAEAARAAVAFTTLAFGRQALQNAGPTFDRHYAVGDESFALADHPLYVEALSAARHCEKEAFQTIAFRSSETNAINAAAHAGSELADLTLSAPRLDPAWVGGRAFESSAQVELKGESEIALEKVREALAAHGSTELDCDVRVFSGVVRDGAVSIQLDVVARHPILGERFVLESTGGIGSGVDGALADVITRFLASSFHPIIAALEDESLGKDQIETEDLVGWRAIQGPVLHQMKVPADLAYGDLLDALLERFCQSEPTREPHWMRVYYMQGPEGPFGLDVLVDNEPWEPGAALVREWDWPREGNTYAIRHFLFLKPSG